MFTSRSVRDMTSYLYKNDKQEMQIIEVEMDKGAGTTLIYTRTLESEIKCFKLMGKVQVFW